MELHYYRLKKDYNMEYDNLYLYIPEKVGYELSYEYDGVIIDIDKTNKIACFEILYASEYFNIPKNVINEIDFKSKIIINKDLIKIKIGLLNPKTNQIIQEKDLKLLNEYNIKVGEYYYSTRYFKKDIRWMLN